MRLPTSLLEPEAIAAFPEDARRAIYDVMSLRRDIRHFRPGLEIDPAALDRILGAAHQAPSVGFSQPWGFVVVRDVGVRDRIRKSFLRCRDAEAIRFPPERREAYLAHRLEGILEAPLNLCVAVDLRDRGEAILGTTAQPEAVRASACCAVQNLWLAARAEGVGVGWVSIVEPAVLRAELGLPPGVEPVAYLCLGHPVAFRDRPMLEETGWRVRRPLSEVVHGEGRWSEAGAMTSPHASASELLSPVSSPALSSPESLSPVSSPALSSPELPSAALPAPALSSAALASPAPSAPSSVIHPTDRRVRRTTEKHLASLTKPMGSLGRLEHLAAWYASVRGVFPPPPIDRAALALFVADHGVVVEGVSAFGSQVTSAMVANVMSGGAAINAIAAESRVDILLTDVGVAGDLSAAPINPVVDLLRAKVRAGTGNLRREPAMLPAEADAAMAIGARVARGAIERGAAVIGLAEIGIANTTSAAALIAAMTGCDPAQVVGRGTGVSDEVLARKVAVVKDALALHKPRASSPMGALAAVGGLEIAALVGCALEAARLRVPVVLDGFVTNAAALVASRLDPALREYLLAAHRSPEPGAPIALAELGLVPVFDLGMRLGEGTGAALAMALLRTAIHTARAMATFATAGMVGRAGVGAPAP